MKSFKFVSPLVAGIALLGAVGGAAAQAIPGNAGYWVDGRGNVAKSGTGLCWRTSAWTPALAVAECEPGMMPKPVAAAPMAKPEPAPMPMAKPAPAPAPVVAAPAPAPKPMPKETWQTKVTQKPVRLDGASFDVGSSRLQRGDIPGLEEVVSTATEHPEINFVVEGYTSNTGGEQMNQRLSEERANSVKRYLVGKGVAAERITTKGFGEANPIADNNTAEGREANRRVEIRYTVTEETRVRAMPR